MEPEQNKDSGNEVENLYSDREGDDEGATNAVVDSSEPSSVQPSPPPVLAEICALPPPIPVPVLDTESTTPVVSVSTEEIAPAESANITDMTTDKPKKRKKKSASKKKKTSGRKTGKPTAPVAFASTEEIAFAEIPSLTDMVTDKPKTCNKKSAPKKKKTSGRKPGKPRRGDPRAAQKNSVPVVKAVVVPTKVHTHHPSHYGNRPSESTDQKSSGSSISSKDKGIPIATVIGGDHHPDDGFDLEKGVAKPKHRFYKSRCFCWLCTCILVGFFVGISIPLAIFAEQVRENRRSNNNNDDPSCKDEIQLIHPESGRTGESCGSGGSSSNQMPPLCLSQATSPQDVSSFHPRICGCPLRSIHDWIGIFPAKAASLPNLWVANLWGAFLVCHGKDDDTPCLHGGRNLESPAGTVPATAGMISLLPPGEDYRFFWVDGSSTWPYEYRAYSEPFTVVEGDACYDEIVLEGSFAEDFFASASGSEPPNNEFDPRQRDHKSKWIAHPPQNEHGSQPPPPPPSRGTDDGFFDDDKRTNDDGFFDDTFTYDDGFFDEIDGYIYIWNGGFTYVSNQDNDDGFFDDFVIVGGSGSGSESGDNDDGFFDDSASSDSSGSGDNDDGFFDDSVSSDGSDSDNGNDDGFFDDFISSGDDDDGFFDDFVSSDGSDSGNGNDDGFFDDFVSSGDDDDGFFDDFVNSDGSGSDDNDDGFVDDFIVRDDDDGFF